MAEYDTKAFNAMQEVTKNKSFDLFRESEYNTIATPKDRLKYDQEALNILRGMYTVDSTKGDFKHIDFEKYTRLLKPELFEERVFSPGGDLKAGDFFGDIYERDFDQFRASALRAVPNKAKAIGTEAPGY